MGLAKVRKERLLVGEEVAATVEWTMMDLLVQHGSKWLLVLAELTITTSFFTVIGYYHAATSGCQTAGAISVVTELHREIRFPEAIEDVPVL